MVLVARYQFIDSTDLGLDSSGNDFHAINTDVTSVSDPERGVVGSFNGTTSFLETTDTIGVEAPVLLNSRKSSMAWIKSTGSGGVVVGFGTNRNAYHMLTSSTSAGYSVGTPSGASSVNTRLITFTPDVWTHVAVIQLGGTSFRIYIDGVLRSSASSATTNTLDSNLTVGRLSYSSLSFFEGLMTDVRVYDNDLSASEVIAAFQESPVFLFGLIPSSTVMESTWLSVSNAVSYRITADSGSGESIVSDSITSTSTVIYNLIPSVTYTFRLYYSLDGTSYTLTETGISTMSTNTGPNANMQIFLKNGVYDFTVLNRATRRILERHISSTLVNGVDIVLNDEDVQVNELRNRRLSVVRTGTSSRIVSDALLFAFNEDDGSSQNVTLELEDSSIVPVSYDETTDEISIGGSTYSDGDIFVLDGKKVTVYNV